MDLVKVPKEEKLDQCGKCEMQVHPMTVPLQMVLKGVPGRG
jgi:hypothetical protein